MLKFISDILPQEGIFGLHNDSAASAIVISALVVFTYAATYSIAAILRRFFANIQLKKFSREAQILADNRMFKKLSALIPPIVFLFVIPLLFPREDVGDTIFVVTEKVLFLYFYIVLWIFLVGAVNVFNDLISVRSIPHTRRTRCFRRCANANI